MFNKYDDMVTLTLYGISDCCICVSQVKTPTLFALGPSHTLYIHARAKRIANAQTSVKNSTYIYVPAHLLARHLEGSLQ